MNPPALTEVIGTAPDGTEILVLDRIAAMIRAGIFMGVVASAVGLDPSTVKGYIKRGGKLMRKLEQGEVTLADLSDTDLACVELTDKVQVGMAAYEIEMVELGNRHARGGLSKRVVTTRTNSAGDVIEQTTRDEILPGDPAMIRWILGKRFPERWGGEQIELTGPNGGPIAVEMSTDERRRTIAEKLKVTATRIASNAHEWEQIAETTPDDDVPLIPGLDQKALTTGLGEVAGMIADG